MFNGRAFEMLKEKDFNIYILTEGCPQPKNPGTPMYKTYPYHRVDYISSILYP